MKPQIVNERDFDRGERWDCSLPVATFDIRSGDKVGISGGSAEIIPYQQGMTLWGIALQNASKGQTVKVKYPQNESWINGSPRAIWCYTKFNWG